MPRVGLGTSASTRTDREQGETMRDEREVVSADSIAPPVGQALYQPGSWWALKKAGLAGLVCVGHYDVHRLQLGDEVVVLDGAAMITGRVSRDPRVKLFTLFVVVDSVVSHSMAPSNMVPGNVYLVGGFQTFVRPELLRDRP